jgi:K+-transporting ATPase ATPase A chain
MLGTNGGGFFNANSAHPFENPTPWTNLFQLLLILVIPISLPRTFGRMVGDNRQGYAILAVMSTLAIASIAAVSALEVAGHGTAPQLAGGAMEGKEQRFGIVGSALYAAVTTLTSTGAVNSMHDSYTATGGMIPLLNMMLGEVALAAWVGPVRHARARDHRRVRRRARRSHPEYLGKKIGPTRDQAREPVHPGDSDPGAGGNGVELRHPRRARRRRGDLDPQSRHPRHDGGALRVHVGREQQRLGVRRTHRNTPWFNTALGVVMLLGRFVPIVLVLALAGSLAAQERVPATAGTADAPPAVRRPARGRDRGHHRTHLLPRSRAGSPGRRSLLT